MLHSLKAARARSVKHLRKRFMHGVGYLHGGELQVKLHDPEDCGEYRVNVPMHDVCRWLSVRDHDEIFPKFLADTDAARARLLRWFMGTNGMLFLYAENVGGKGGTKLSVRCCHYEHVAAQTIIGCWKGMKAKLKMKDMIAGIWRKQLDPATRTFVYYNVNSREFKKEKPLCLGTKDLEASAKWEPRQDDKGRTYYVHLKTGRVSLYSEAQAAVVLQRRFRKRQAAYFQVPMGDLVKALKMQAQAELSYALDPTSLESRINYALYQHAVCHARGPVAERSGAFEMPPLHVTQLCTMARGDISLSRSVLLRGSLIDRTTSSRACCTSRRCRTRTSSGTRSCTTAWRCCCSPTTARAPRSATSRR